MTGPITLAQIWIYPIKSLGGVRLTETIPTESGSLPLDREWVVVDSEDQKLWQGDLPKMAMSRCRLEADRIVATLPGMPDLVVFRDHDGQARTIGMYKHSFAGTDAGDAAAEWLTEAFGRPARLVRIRSGAHHWPGLNPVHVVSLESIAALNASLAERGEPPVELERFRPSLVLDSAGTEPPFFEERDEAIQFGDAELRFREPCVRCELPNISRSDGTRLKQPLKLIGALSRERPTAVPASFGTYAHFAGRAPIREGMRGVAGVPRSLAPVA